MSLCVDSICQLTQWCHLITTDYRKLQIAGMGVGVGCNNEPGSQWDIYYPDFILNLNVAKFHFNITYLYVRVLIFLGEHDCITVMLSVKFQNDWATDMEAIYKGGGGGGGGAIVHQIPVDHRDKWMDVVTSNPVDNLSTHIVMTSCHGRDFCITGYLWWRSLVIDDFPSQIPVMWRFDMFSLELLGPNLFVLDGWMEGAICKKSIQTPLWKVSWGVAYDIPPKLIWKSNLSKLWSLMTSIHPISQVVLVALLMWMQIIHSFVPPDTSVHSSPLLHAHIIKKINILCWRMKPIC